MRRARPRPRPEYLELSSLQMATSTPSRGPCCAFCGSSDRHRLRGPRAPWQYYRCGACGHTALEPSPRREELAAYYNATYQVPLADYREAARIVFPVIEKLVGSRPRKMLEIGCSYGFLLAHFRAAGWATTGIEIDRRAAAYARDTLGLDVRGGRLEDVAADLEGRFDVIALFHVIEHIPEPEAFMSRLRGLLAPGGMVVLRTPNAASFGARLLGGWWEWCALPEHVHLYSPESLRRLFARTGLVPGKLLTRKGDARGIIHQAAHALARSMVRREYRPRQPGTTDGGNARPVVVRGIGGLLDALSRPLDLVLQGSPWNAGSEILATGTATADATSPRPA